MESAASILKPWENFYVIVGGAAAALTGLVFVVITIVTSDPSRPRSREATAIFTTPTVVHFGAALLLAILLSVPWKTIVQAAIPVAIVGTFGLGYLTWIGIRMSRLADYRADLEDTIWHTMLPLGAYAALVIGAFACVGVPSTSMLLYASAATLLIFIGIHNAWDIVTFLAVKDADEDS